MNRQAAGTKVFRNRTPSQGYGGMVRLTRNLGMLVIITQTYIYAYL